MASDVLDLKLPNSGLWVQPSPRGSLTFPLAVLAWFANMQKRMYGPQGGKYLPPYIYLTIKLKYNYCTD